MPADLVESELFGHVRGAYSGATASHAGSFEQAAGGTLFLDEIGELPLAIQPKLLRVLEERVVQPLGATAPRPLDVRIVAATNRNLVESVGRGEFRSDLFHRFNAFPVRIAPLRERPADIAALVKHVHGREQALLGVRLGAICTADLEALKRYPWPGNVRELQNVLRRAAILSGPETFMLPPDWRTSLAVSEPDAERTDDLNQWMRAHIQRTLSECDWHLEGRDGAAERLGLAPSTLRYRLKKLGLSRPA